MESIAFDWKNHVLYGLGWSPTKANPTSADWRQYLFTINTANGVCQHVMALGIPTFFYQKLAYDPKLDRLCAGVWSVETDGFGQNPTPLYGILAIDPVSKSASGVGQIGGIPEGRLYGGTFDANGNYMVSASSSLPLPATSLGSAGFAWLSYSVPRPVYIGTNLENVENYLSYTSFLDGETFSSLAVDPRPQSPPTPANPIVYPSIYGLGTRWGVNGGTFGLFQIDTDPNVVGLAPTGLAASYGSPFTWYLPDANGNLPAHTPISIAFGF
jgi:hypothetical protein